MSDHTMQYYSAIKTIEVLIHTIAWMAFENIKRSEIRDSEGQTFYESIYVQYIGKLMETKEMRRYQGGIIA